MKHLLALFLIYPFVSAAMPAADCDSLGNSLIANANFGMGGFDQILTIKNGKAELNKSSSRIRSFKTEGKEVVVTFNRQIPINGVITEIKETVRFLTNDEGYVVNYMTDAKASPPGMLGQKATVKRNDSGTCSLEQFSTLMKNNSEKPTEVVNQDSKYCESVSGLMKEMGKASFDQCHDLLVKASAALNQRAMSLMAEQKLFVESGVGNTMQIAISSLDNCGPDEWYATMNTPMGPQRVLKMTNSVHTESSRSVNKKGVK